MDRANIQTLTPASLQVSASASSAAWALLPHCWEICDVMSFAEHTALMSEGLSYVFTTPRRQPGGLAALAMEATAAKATTKTLLENILSGDLDRSS